MTSYSVTDARATLPELITRVQGGDEVTITRRGEVVAVLVGPDRLRSRRATDAFLDAERLHDLLTSTPSGPASPLTAVRAEELVAAMRRDRDSG